MRMKTTITFELESGIREQLAAICDRYNLSLEEAFTLFAATLTTINKCSFGKQAGDLRDCADHRLVLLQRTLIKSNCYSSLSAAIH